MIGRTYLERGQPVTVVAAWRGKQSEPERVLHEVHIMLPMDRKSGPRNVLIRRADGSLVVRPFRGLRKPAQSEAAVS